MYFLKVIYYFELLAILWLCIWQGRKEGFSNNRLVPYYFLLVCLTEIIGNLCVYVWKIENGWVYNIYLLIYPVYFCYYLSLDILPNKNRIALYTIQFLSLILQIYFLYSKGYIDFNVYSGIIVSFSTLSYALIWFFMLIQYPNEIPLLKNRSFWFSCAILLWGSFFIFRNVPMFLIDSHDPHFMNILQITFNVINIVVYLLFFRGLLCKSFQMK